MVTVSNKAIVLAAGRGERMRPLTDKEPKPLLRAGGRSLIEWQIERLVRAGFRNLVINVSHLGAQIESTLGDGAHLGAQVEYSREPVALETAGGIAQALTLLGHAPFLAVNADIYCDYDYLRLRPVLDALADERTAWSAYLVLVDNPEHHGQGDFCLGASGILHPSSGRRLTFSGIGVYRPALFAAIAPGERRALGPLLHSCVAAQAVRGEYFPGLWMDIGTRERLQHLRDRLGSKHAC